MGRFVLGMCCVLLGAGVPGPRAQQSQQVFRGGVDLVTIDVTVVDKDGKPVTGLTPDDFVVSLENQPRPVRALDFLQFGTSAGSATTAAHETTNQSPRGASRGGRVIVLLFDDLSYTPGLGKLLLVSAERMLPTFDVDDLVGIATTSGLGPMVSPTRDRSTVLAAMHDRRMIGRYDDSAAPFYIAQNEAIDIDRGIPRDTLTNVAARECGKLFLPLDQCTPMIEAHARSLVQQTFHRIAMQLAAYREVIEALHAAPTPRVMIVFSRGLAVGVEADIRSQMEPISRAAAEAEVQFYALSEVPDDIDMSAQGEATQNAEREEGRFLNSGIQTVASAAGGDAFLVVGQADRFIQRIERETSGFYRLGVEAPILSDKRRFLATKVSVHRPGVTVRVNRQALMASVAPEAVPVEQRLKAALAQGGVAFGVPIALGTAQRRDPGSAQLQVAVSVQMPESVPGPLIAMFGLVNATGQIVQAGRKDVAVPAAGSDYQLAFPVPLPAGAYRLRFVVADAKGNVGGVEQSVTAGLSHLGAFSASDLLTTWAGTDGAPRFLALETLPSAATTLDASLELYPDSPGAAPDATVRFELVPIGQDAALFTRDLTPTTTGQTRSAIAELPVGTLKPGAYTIRATVLQAGVAVGTVSTVIRKSGGSEPGTRDGQ